jgi:hypothetical protein
VGEGRKFSDPQGREWTVVESGSNGDCSLLFETADSIRRVRQYPAAWRGLSVEELIALSWTR